MQDIISAKPKTNSRRLQDTETPRYASFNLSFDDCEGPVDPEDLYIIAHLGIGSGSLPVTTKFPSHGVGRRTAVIPVKGMPKEEESKIIETICEGLADAIGHGCATISQLSIGQGTTICTSIATAVALTGKGAIASGKLFAYCEKGFLAAKMYCTLTQNPQSPLGPNRLVDICKQDGPNTMEDIYYPDLVSIGSEAYFSP